MTEIALAALITVIAVRLCFELADWLEWDHARQVAQDRLRSAFR